MGSVRYGFVLFRFSFLLFYEFDLSPFGWLDLVCVRSWDWCVFTRDRDNTMIREM